MDKTIFRKDVFFCAALAASAAAMYLSIRLGGGWWFVAAFMGSWLLLGAVFRCAGGSWIISVGGAFLAAAIIFPGVVKLYERSDHAQAIRDEQARVAARAKAAQDAQRQAEITRQNRERAAAQAADKARRLPVSRKEAESLISLITADQPLRSRGIRSIAVDGSDPDQLVVVVENAWHDRNKYVRKADAMGLGKLWATVHAANPTVTIRALSGDQVAFAIGADSVSLADE
ncbi:hypothetical protein EV699_111136 [Plasticicumulans lactativorans]|uniref:Uncharacterized protein n=1 Tax=Plasticicumulans lactativorans TaxID=1133106 RepID=A0A4R2LNA9_9GAMM|nr:hypothetical protein [Plasticicumulans lactativorans]TCO80935.1 hypothetical protein EV699_111136 [Plasticicumulans lactativorans]